MNIKSMSSLPDEKLSQLRQVIHGHVSQGRVQEQIRACLSEALAQDGGRHLDEDTLLQVLEERGLVDQVMKNLDLSTTNSETHDVEAEVRTKPLHEHHYSNLRPPKDNVAMVTKGVLSSSKRCLFLQVLGGCAFLDHLSDPTPCHHAHFTLHVYFRGQRYHSREVPCACEPDFKEGFLLELERLTSGDSGGHGRMLSCEDALSLSDMIHLALTLKNHRGEVDLVGTVSLDWRRVLCEETGRISSRLELSGVGTEAKISPGILDLRIDLMPRPHEPLNSELLSAQVSLEKQRIAEKERLFLVYAKQWWKEYLQLRPKHAKRLVKIFAPDEVGLSRLVCCYVCPLRGGRLLESPRHAARFVSLIPFEKTGSVGNGGCCNEMWGSAFSMLVSKKGDCEGHACLLCSLLVGFGLEAYVCIGTKSKGLAHAWVMTCSHDGGVVFWESITGQRYLQALFNPDTQAGVPRPPPSHPYRTIGCLFNHKSFFANSQPSDDISTCNFDIRNSCLWQPMSTEAIRSVSKGVWFPPLLPPVVDSALAANELEGQLRTLTSQHREDLGLSTYWDDDLCYLLSPALSAYETERCLGVGGVGNEEFQEAIRHAVPDGHTFKGFPIQILHRNSRKAFNTSLQSPVCAEILGCRGEHVRLAVRVKIYFYPENVCAVWIMFAVKYRSVL